MKAAIGERMFGFRRNGHASQQVTDTTLPAAGVQAEQPVGTWYKKIGLTYDNKDYYRIDNFIPIRVPDSIPEKRKEKVLKAVVSTGSNAELAGVLRRLVDKELFGPGYTAEDSTMPFVYPCAELIPLDHGTRMAFIKISSPMLRESDPEQWVIRVKKMTDRLMNVFVGNMRKALPLQWYTPADNSKILEVLKEVDEAAIRSISIDILNVVKNEKPEDNDEPGPLEEKFFGNAPGQGGTIGIGDLGGPI